MRKTGAARKRRYNKSQASEIGRRLRQLRGPLTREEFASKVGVRATSIYRFETGLSIPNRESLLKLAEATGATPMWILEGRKISANEDVQLDYLTRALGVLKKQLDFLDRRRKEMRRALQEVERDRLLIRSFMQELKASDLEKDDDDGAFDDQVRYNH